MSITHTVRIFQRVSLNAVLVLLFSCSPGYAQRLEDAVERPQSIPSNADWINNNYFDAPRDPVLKDLLYKVERAHFSDPNFWKWFNAGQYQYALADLKYALWVFPNHPNALLMMGSIAKLTHNLSLPIPYYEKALRLYPEYALIYAQYGAYLVDIGRVDVGIAKLTEAVTIDPKLASAHAKLAEAHYKNGHPELARIAAGQARELGYRGRIAGDGQDETPR